MDLRRDWYIEAWSVRDGLAFASYRTAGSIANHERTVFIGVPGLEAVPLGRISPALWATRANFQDRLLTEKGEEIAFSTLAQVRELVRRGYLAGGIGPGPGGEGGEGPDRGGPPRPSPSIGREMDDRLKKLGTKQPFAGLQGIGRAEDRMRLFESLLKPDLLNVVYEGLAIVATATIVAWYDVIQQSTGRFEDAPELARWIDLLMRNARLWSSEGEFWRQIGIFRVPAGAVEGIAEFFPYPVPYPFPMWLGGGETAGEDILFHVPCPLRSGWDQRIRRLSDKLLLAVSTQAYFDGNPNLPELMPAVLAALAVVSLSLGPLVIWSDDARRERLRAALEWLSDQMPQEQLPPAAEAALQEFAWKELSRP